MISVISMENAENFSVTAFYMNTIFKAAKLVDVSERFSFDSLPNKKNLVIVSTVIEAFKLILYGYGNIGIWIQGLYPEESYMRNKSSIRKCILNVIEKICLTRANILFVVSQEMISHYKQKYKIDITEKSVVMPCFNAILNKDAFKDENKGNTSFAYVGSLAPWQCFKETVLLYKTIEDNRTDNRTDTILYIFTPDIEEANSICKELINNYRVMYINMDELDEWLAKMDYGFILRENIEVNRVATPTKISNYLANGVIPIYSQCIKSFNSIGQELDYALGLDELFDINKIIDFCSRPKDINKIMKEYEYVFDTYYNSNKYIETISTKIRGIMHNA